MTKGKDVKQLYSKLGLQPTDYQEVRADEEVTRSIEERWPLLRDLLSSLAQSLEPETGEQEAVSHVVPEPEQTAQPAEMPPQPAAVTPVELPEPPAPSWLQQPGTRPAESRPLVPEPQSEPRPVPRSAAADTSDSGESLAERLERLYGHSAPVVKDEKGGGVQREYPDIPVAEVDSGRGRRSGDELPDSDLPAPGISDFDDELGEEESPPPKTGESSLLGRLLARPQREAEEPEPAPQPEVLAPRDWGFTSESDAPSARQSSDKAVEESSPAVSSAGDPDLSEILHRLTPTEEPDEPEKDGNEVEQGGKPKKDLQSMFARLRKGGGQ